MFERRLKIFLGILLIVTVALVLRAMQLQVLNRGHWADEATESLKRARPLETTRGSILDARDRVIAVDEACIDACVDFRAISDQPDPKWLNEQALARLRRLPGDEYRRAPAARRREMLDAEKLKVKADIEAMWVTLADVTGHSVEDVEAARQAVLRKVRARKRVVWYARYRRALREHEGREPSPWYRRWLIDDDGDAPEVDTYQEKVAEEEDAHVIVSGIENETYIGLKKNIERYPGLELRGGKRRVYPWYEAGCHIIGQLAKVQREDLAADPNLGIDTRRQYQFNDLIGRSGLEALLEPSLRGTRGEVTTLVSGDGGELERKEPVPGKNVRTTIDIALQWDAQRLFERARITDGKLGTVERAMHGAAIVIDIPTGEVRALASYPTYDPNSYDMKIGELMADKLNAPLLNRATQVRYEPGSTIKPVSGIAAVAEGLVGPHHGVECTGFLVLNGKKYSRSARCWVASMFHKRFGDDGVRHHQIPDEAPHRGTHGNPDGFLTLADALERSCNVYFETLADRMSFNTLSRYYSMFGLGRETGIGIGERPGLLPSSYSGPRAAAQSALWFSSIGQGQVLASPIQMANVAATIARDGVWMRPRLVSAGVETRPIMVRDPADPEKRVVAPDKVDLKLPPDALAAVREGMVRVVNSEAGTGKNVRRTDMLVAGKTGTAEASRIRWPRANPDGSPQTDEKGRPVYDYLQQSSIVGGEAPRHPQFGDIGWYRGYGEEGGNLKHSWFIGFAPAPTARDPHVKPQIAYAVMVEYGGGGGANAGPIAAKLLDACVRHGYLKPPYDNGSTLTNANGSAAVPEQDIELLNTAGPH